MLNTRFFLLFGLVLPVLVCCSRMPGSFYLDFKVVESVPEGRHLLHYPADGVKVGVNPPGFTWTSHDSANNYCFVLFHDSIGEKIHLTHEGLTSTVVPYPSCACPYQRDY